jgi:hypothetical protein
MSSHFPSVPVGYYDYRVSSAPIHCNLSDYRQFAPQAVAAGWLPGPTPKSLGLVVTDVPFDLDSSSNTQGFHLGQSLLFFFGDHMDQVNFYAAAGDYAFRFILRTPSGLTAERDVSIHLETRGSFSLAFVIVDYLFSYAVQSSESGTPTCAISPNISAVDELLLLTAPMHPNSDFVDISGYSYMSVVALPIDSTP